MAVPAGDLGGAGARVERPELVHAGHRHPDPVLPPGDVPRARQRADRARRPASAAGRCRRASLTSPSASRTPRSAWLTVSATTTSYPTSAATSSGSRHRPFGSLKAGVVAVDQAALPRPDPAHDGLGVRRQLDQAVVAGVGDQEAPPGKRDRLGREPQVAGLDGRRRRRASRPAAACPGPGAPRAARRRARRWRGRGPRRRTARRRSPPGRRARASARPGRCRPARSPAPGRRGPGARPRSARRRPRPGRPGRPRARTSASARPTTTSSPSYFSSTGRSSSRTCRQLMQQNAQKSSSTKRPRRSARRRSSPPVFSQPRPRSSGARTRGRRPVSGVLTPVVNAISGPRVIPRGQPRRAAAVLAVTAASHRRQSSRRWPAGRPASPSCPRRSPSRAGRARGGLRPCSFGSTTLCVERSACSRATSAAERGSGVSPWTSGPTRPRRTADSCSADAVGQLVLGNSAEHLARLGAQHAGCCEPRVELPAQALAQRAEHGRRLLARPLRDDRQGAVEERVAGRRGVQDHQPLAVVEVDPAVQAQLRRAALPRARRRRTARSRAGGRSRRR